MYLDVRRTEVRGLPQITRVPPYTVEDWVVLKSGEVFQIERMTASIQKPRTRPVWRFKSAAGWHSMSLVVRLATKAEIDSSRGDDEGVSARRRG